MRSVSTLLALALSTTVALPVAAQDASTVAATVNGTEITVGHMIDAYVNLPQQLKDLPANVLFSGVLDQLIQQEVLAQAFDGELSMRAEVVMENHTRSVRAGEEIDELFKRSITSAAIQSAYDARYAGQDPGLEFNASHILVETEEEAIAIKETLEGGADFAATARKDSTGPSGPNGGSLGWFSEGMMVPPFEAAVKALDEGQISDPVQTQFGWHVILLNEKRAANLPELEEVRDDLIEQVRQDTLTTYIARLVDAAEVTSMTNDEIDPEVIKDIDLMR